MNSQQQQALALAAVFEAATLADQIATSGDCDQAAMEALLDGVMSMQTMLSTRSVSPRLQQLSKVV